jgi:hypothetical protein
MASEQLIEECQAALAYFTTLVNGNAENSMPGFDSELHKVFLGIMKEREEDSNWMVKYQ